MENSTKLKQIASAIVVVVLILIGGKMAFGKGPSADEIARQAYEQRIKAMKKHCEQIGEKVAACYSGDMEMCDKLQDSIAWFTGEYNQAPELACSAAPDPLGFGDERK
jgi:hypothetical protein